MAKTLLSCDGIGVGPIQLPPFQVKVGDYVCLHLPVPYLLAEKDLLIQVLTGQRPVAGLHLQGRVLWADPIWGKTGLGGLWERLRRRVVGSPSALAWLCRVGHLVPAEALPRLERLGINPSWRLNQMACNPKMQLGLETAWIRGAELVVFCLTGCDPRGKLAARHEVAAHLEDGAAMEISFPFLQGGQLQRDCQAGAMCLDVNQVAPSLAPVAR